MTKHSRLKERDNWKERKYVDSEMFNFVICQGEIELEFSKKGELFLQKLQ